MKHTTPPVIFITGAAKRLGRAIAQHLHAQGANLSLHYFQSEQEVKSLADTFNAIRPDSTHIIKANLHETQAEEIIAEVCSQHDGQLNGIIHNASSFFRTPIGSVNQAMWQDLITTNMMAPFFLSQAAAPILKKYNGAITFMLDIFTERPMLHHPVYSAAKAGAEGLMKALALELAPEIRVNGVAPGGPIMCDNSPPLTETQSQTILLKRQGHAIEIAEAVTWLTLHATFTTGQIIRVDGGQHLVMHHAALPNKPFAQTSL